MEIGKEWDNKAQQQTDENQYKVFTHLNGWCSPSPTLAGGLENAMKAIEINKADPTRDVPYEY